MVELKDTVNKMISANYKDRFIAEYMQTKIRYDKLKYFIYEIETAKERGVEEPKHDCSIDLLKEQQSAMGYYLRVLEKRAMIEKVSLPHLIFITIS